MGHVGNYQYTMGPLSLWQCCQRHKTPLKWCWSQLAATLLMPPKWVKALFLCGSGDWWYLWRRPQTSPVGIWSFFYVEWVVASGGVPLYAAVKSLSPHCDQEGQGRDNFFSKCIFYARSYGGNVKNRSKKCEEPSVIGPESSIPDLKSNSILFSLISNFLILS